MHDTVLSTVGTMLYSRSLEIIHQYNGNLYLLCSKFSFCPPSSSWQRPFNSLYVWLMYIPHVSGIMHSLFFVNHYMCISSTPEIMFIHKWSQQSKSLHHSVYSSYIISHNVHVHVLVQHILSLYSILTSPLTPIWMIYPWSSEWFISEF